MIIQEKSFNNIPPLSDIIVNKVKNIASTINSGLIFLSGKAGQVRRVFYFVDTFLTVAKKDALIAAEKIAKISSFLQFSPENSPVKDLTVLKAVYSTKVLSIISALNEIPNLFKHGYKVIKQSGAKQALQLVKTVKSAASICGRVGDFISGLSLLTTAVKISELASRALGAIGLLGSAINLGLDSRKLDQTRQAVKDFKEASQDYNKVREFLKIDDLITSSDANTQMEEALQAAFKHSNISDLKKEELLKEVKQATTEEDIRALCKGFVRESTITTLVDVIKLKRTTNKLCTLFAVEGKDDFIKKLKTTFPEGGTLGEHEKSMVQALTSRLAINERNGAAKVIMDVLGIAQSVLLFAAVVQPEIILGFAVFGILTDIVQHFITQKDNYNFECEMGLRDRSVKVQESGVEKVKDFAKWYFEKGTIHDIITGVAGIFSPKENAPVVA